MAQYAKTLKYEHRMIAEFAFEHGYIKGGGQRLPYWIKKIVVLHGFSILRQSRGCESYFFLHSEHPNVPRFVHCFAVGRMTGTSPAGEVPRHSFHEGSPPDNPC